MAQNPRPARRPRGAPEIPVRSVRVSDPIWDRAARRARHEGTTMSNVLHTFVEGYGEGLIDLPQLRVVYAQKQRTEAASVPAPD